MLTGEGERLCGLRLVGGRKAKLVSDVMSGLFCFGCCGRGKSSLPSLLTGAAEFYCFGSCFIACSV